MSKRGLKFIVFVQCSKKPLRFFCPINSKWPKPFRCQTTGSREKERRSCGPAKFGRAIAQQPMTSLELSFSCRSMRSTTILERAATAFGQNAPSFSPGCVLITFSKILLPLEKLPLCVSDFGHDLSETTKSSRFHNFAFQELSRSSPFVSSSQCRRPNFWKS